MRIRLLAALAALFVASGAAHAQAPKAEPTVEIRLRSVNDLLDKAEYVAALGGQEEQVKQVKAFLKQLSTDGKGIEGIDPKKPFGLTGTLSADVVSSPLTVMVPVADQERFLAMLKDRLQLTPEKAEGGTLKVEVPVVNEVYLRFANEYVYIGRSVKDLDPKAIPTPQAFFLKDDGSVASVIVRLDGVPADLKTFVLGQFEMGLAEQRKKDGPNENAAQKAIGDWASENITSGFKALLEDAKELRVRVFVDEKSDDLSGELTLTAKSGSTLAKNLTSLGGKKSLPAAVAGAGKDTVARFAAKAGVPDGVKKDLGKVVDAAIVEILKDVPEEQKTVAERALKTLAPTFKAGELDLAVALNGPDTKGHHTLIGAVGVKGGADIEKLVKDFAKDFGPFLGDAVKFDFDVEKVGAFNLHTITANALPDDAEKVFGTKKIWLATSEDYIAFSVEPDGTALKAGLKAVPVAAPVLVVDVAFAKLLPLVGKDLKPDEVKALLRDAFGNDSPAGRDTLSVVVTGGDALTVKGKLKGKGVRLLTGLEQFKTK